MVLSKDARWSLGVQAVGTLLRATQVNLSPPDRFLLQVFAESIFHLVRDKYAALADARCPASHARHKFLAGIVMTRGEWRSNTNLRT